MISAGACAINGNIPALRNDLSLRKCLEEPYIVAASCSEHARGQDQYARLLFAVEYL
jgi:hypothetical protein